MIENSRINYTKTFPVQTYHISYCFYGELKDTTSIVLQDNYFYTFRGNHFEALKTLASDTSEGLKNCLKYFMDNKDLHCEENDSLSDTFEVTPWKMPN